MSTRPDPPQRVASAAKAGPQAVRQGRRIAGLALVVLAAHLALLGGMTGRLDWRLPSAEPLRVATLQTRWVPPATVPAASLRVPPSGQARTRIATVPTAPAVPVPAPTTPSTTAGPADPPAEAGPASSAEAAPPAAFDTSSPAPPPVEPSTAAPRTETLAEPAPAPLAATQDIPLTQAAFPPIPLGALPPSVLLSYKLTGQERGLNYFANGELRWQHNAAAYALSLSVKAFLVGSRHWRSVGEINETGLAPRRFSDSWRNERAAHFDRANQRVVFSNNAPMAPLEAGAQDQISLYVQLAAAMAGAPQRFEPGSRVQIQTATVKDALPWLLTLEASETLQLNGLAVSTVKWVCQPRHRFDATVAFWVSAQHAWMPVRIRITQVNGSYIDLTLSGQEALPPLPTSAA